MYLDKIVSTDTALLEFAQNFKDSEVIYVEESIKIIDNNLSAGRLLFKVMSKDISIDEIERILSKLNFPEEYFEKIRVWFKWSIFVMISLDVESEIYKIYFERPINENCVREQKIGSICSMKWGLHDSSDIVFTDYHSILTKRIDYVFRVAGECGVNLLPNFINTYLNKISLIHFWVSQDTNSVRKSICIPFIYNTMFLKNIGDASLSEKLFKYSHLPIRHFQIGKDKNNKEFKTIYFSSYRKNYDDTNT
jgi:hypothetical protein